MRYLDRQTFNNMNPSEKRKLIGNFFYNDKYLVFEPGDESQWEKLVTEVNEKGRENVSIDGFLLANQEARVAKTRKNVKNKEKVSDVVEIHQIVDKLKKGGSVNLKELSKIVVYLYDACSKQ